MFDDHFLVFHPLPSRFHSDWSEKESRRRGKRQVHETPHVVFKRDAALLSEGVQKFFVEEKKIVTGEGHLDGEGGPFCDVSK